MVEKSPLAESLREQLQRTGMTVDTLADRTKIPRSTIRALLEDPLSAVLPERVYLRGHTSTLAREMGMDVDDVLRAFDERYPIEPPEADDLEGSWARRSAIVGAGLGCFALIAVVVAFASVF
jgi:cytoskeletal protein RodZ